MFSLLPDNKGKIEIRGYLVAKESGRVINLALLFCLVQDDIEVPAGSFILAISDWTIWNQESGVAIAG